MFDRFWLDYWGKTLIGFDLIIEGKLRKPIHGHILNRFWKVVSSSFKWTYSIQISFLCFDCQGKTSHPNTEYPLKLNNKYSRHWFFEGETPFSIGGRRLNVILYLWLLHLGIRGNIPRGHGILPEGFYTPKTLIYLYIYIYVHTIYVWICRVAYTENYRLNANSLLKQNVPGTWLGLSQSPGYLTKRNIPRLESGWWALAEPPKFSFGFLRGGIPILKKTKTHGLPSPTFLH